jgi:hypothetical protein
MKVSSEQKVYALDPVAISQDITENLQQTENQPSSVLSLLLKTIKDQDKERRMAFDVVPDRGSSGVAGFYQQKIGLTPNHILRKISGA